MDITEMTEETCGKEDLIRQCAEEFLVKHPKFAGFTVDDVLGHDECRKQIDALAAKKAEELEAQAKKKADAAETEKRHLLNEMAATLAAERSLTVEEIAAKLSPKAAAEATFQEKLEAAGQPLQAVQEIPGLVLEAKEQHGGKLPPCVFCTADEAVLFRAVVIGGIKAYAAIVAQKDLDPEYRETAEFALDRAKYLAEMVGIVIRAWGLDPKGSRVDNRDLYWQICEATRKDTRFAFLLNIVTPVTIEMAKAAKEKEVANQVVRAQAREEVAKLLLATGMVPEAAAKRAHRLVKEYLDDAKGDITIALRRAAVNKTRSAQTDEEKAVAGQYVQAAGMSEKDLADGIAEVEKAEMREKNLRQFVGWGSMSASAEAARAAKKNGNNKKDGKKRGGKGR